MGARLYSIHVAPPSKSDQKVLSLIREFERSPLKLRVGQYLYLHHRDGLVGDRISNSLMQEIRVHVFGKDVDGKLDEKTIRDAYRLFRQLLSSRPSPEMLARIHFGAVEPHKAKAPVTHA